MVEKSSTCSKSKRKRLKVKYKLYAQRLYKVMLHCHYKILFKNDRNQFILNISSHIVNQNDLF